MKKLLITGANGLVGSAIRNNTEASYLYDIIPLTHEQCDLTDFHSTKAVFDYIKPDYVIHTAAVVGGIGSNMNHPGRFFCTNISINTNVLECARLLKVKKLISFLSTCVFPDNAPHPLRIQDIHSGPPHPSNAAYAHAKRMLDVQSRAYRTEYDCNFITLIPTNLYGPNDNYDLENGHVLPSLIHKAFIARYTNTKLEVWGTGKPLREFLYVEDLVRAILLVLDHYNESDPLIISPDEEIAIEEVVRLIEYYVNLREGCKFLTNKPDGQMSKPSDNSKFKKLFPSFRFTLWEEGLCQTIEDFKYNWERKFPMRGVKFN